MTTTQYLATHQNRFLSELLDLLRIPSVSASTEHQPDMIRCAEAVCNRLLQAGAQRAELIATPGHPIVYAEILTDPAKPTVLVYGHYDVQPADPLELWHSGPFEPVVKDGKIFARGACDDKGQFYMHIKALEAMLAASDTPTNIKFLIEGEEEVGSPNLANFVNAHRQLLACDVVLISDTAMISLNTPSIDVGVRGLSYLEVELTGPNRDLHSGVYGGAVANPLVMLSKMIASLHNDKNEVTIPGFYDQVLEASTAERAKMAEAPFSQADFNADLGIAAAWGEAGYTTNERTGIRPTLEVNGLWGGYIGEGAKTVLPSKAFAKISCRLVPNQRSADIEQLVIDHLKNIAPPQVQVVIRPHHGGEPYLTPIDSIPFRAASAAIEEVFGKAPIPVRGGGSIPICALFEQALGVKVVFLGFGLDSDNLHSPNEKYDVANFYKGIETIPFFHRHFAHLMQAQ
jgi:acetylornithine deacetylase/succinyl-diaminopimelate desuccinylase-like protein